MSKVEERLAASGIVIPDVPVPLAAYVPGVVSGNLVHTSGQLPMVKGALAFKGKLGQDASVEDGYGRPEAATAAVPPALRARPGSCCGSVAALGGGIFLPEEERDAPDAGQRHQGIDDAGHNAALPAADPGDGIKAEEADAAPSEGADDDQRQRDLIHDHGE